MPPQSELLRKGGLLRDVFPPEPAAHATISLELQHPSSATQAKDLRARRGSRSAGPADNEIFMSRKRPNTCGESQVNLGPATEGFEKATLVRPPLASKTGACWRSLNQSLELEHVFKFARSTIDPGLVTRPDCG